MEFAQAILNFIVGGGAAGVIAILFGIVVVLILDHRSLSKDLNDAILRVYDAKDSETQSIKEIIDNYHKGNLNLVQALNEIRIVLITIQNSTYK